MAIKWSKKEATRHLTELKNPFEGVAQGQNGAGQANLLQQLKDRAKTQRQLPRK